MSDNNYLVKAKFLKLLGCFQRDEFAAVCGGGPGRETSLISAMPYCLNPGRKTDNRVADTHK
jgi:hypothetical protein